MRSPRFVGLNDEAKLFWFYVATCRHQTSAGIITLPDGYATVDLNWSVDKLYGAREHLIAAGMIVHDEATDELYVRNWFKHHPPTNKRHSTGLRRLVSEVESETVKAVSQKELDAVEQLAAHNVAMTAETDNLARLLSTRHMGGERSAR